LSSAVSAQVNKTQELAIVNVTVVPMTTDRISSAQTVVIRNGRIAEIGPVGSAAIPKSALRVEGAGKYLIPGLVDSHIHLQQDEAVNQAFLKLFLVNGVTTVLNLYGTPMHLKLRDAIDRGVALGPKIFTSGPPVGAPHGQEPTTMPQEIARAVAAQKQAGYDFMKLHGDMSPETYRRLMTASRDQNLRVVGHAPRNLGTAPMLKERQHAVAHVEEYLYAYFYYGAGKQRPATNSREKIRELAEATARSGTSVISTLAVYRGIADQIGDLDQVLKRREVAFLPHSVGAAWGWWPPGNTYVSRFGKDQIPLFRANYHLLQQSTVGFQQAGVSLLAGTDTPTAAVVPGFSIHDELEALVQSGLTPYQALRTATVNPAIFLGCIRDAGTIERGKRADCVLLKGNPLENIANTASIAGVCRNGQWFSTMDIDAMLKQLSAGGSPPSRVAQ
jgi:hypothetical protein